MIRVITTAIALTMLATTAHAGLLSSARTMTWDTKHSSHYLLSTVSDPRLKPEGLFS